MKISRSERNKRVRTVLEDHLLYKKSSSYPGVTMGDMIDRSMEVFSIANKSLSASFLVDVLNEIIEIFDLYLTDMNRIELERDLYQATYLTLYALEGGNYISLKFVD